MKLVLTIRRSKREMSASWIWRMMLGVGLIGLSLWGVGLCQQVFRTFMGVRPSPVDINFAKLAAAFAWFVFFGPIAVAGLAVLWSILRKVSALDSIETLGERIFHSEGNFHEGSEGLSDEEAADLIKRAHRIAIVLGLASGTFLIVIGTLGLILISSPSMPFSITVWFGILSGVSILEGMATLRRTLRKGDNAWLLPLKVFTRLVLRRLSPPASEDKPRRSEQVP